MNKEKYEAHRAVNILIKSGAVWMSMVELDGIINLSALARQYFGRSQSWISQRIHGCTVMNKQMEFKEDEYAQLAEAYRDIARKLSKAADEIDAATLNPDDVDPNLIDNVEL